MLRRISFTLLITLFIILGIGLVYRALDSKHENQTKSSDGIPADSEGYPDQSKEVFPEENKRSEQDVKDPDLLPSIPSAEVSQGKDSASRSGLATIHLREGYSKLKKREYHEAIPDLEEAVRLDGENPDSYIGLGLAYYRIKDTDKALEALEKAQNLSQGMNSSNAVTHKLLGEIYYEKDDLDKALKHWEKALILDPGDHDLRRRFHKASREFETHRGFNRETTRHFKVQYEGGEQSETGRKIVNILEDAYSQIGGELSYYPRKELTVILYSNQQFRYVTDGPAWSSGIYDGKIRVPIGGLTGDEPVLRQILFHEFTHSLVHSITERCPTWLNEGLAQYFEGRDKNMAGKVMKELYKRKAIVSLELLEGSFLRLNKNQADLVYTESFSAVSYMAERYGIYRVKELLLELSRGNSIDDSFRSALYIPYKEFEKDWMRLFEG